MENIKDATTRLGIRYEAQDRLLSDKLTLFVFIFFVISVIAQSSLILINWSKLPPEVPIFYSRPWGEPMLAAPIFLWILPVSCVVFVLLNLFIALYLIKAHYFLNRVLIVFSAIIAFATLYDVIRLMGLLV